MSNSQDIQFDLVHDGIKVEEFEILSFKNDKLRIIKSKNGTIEIKQDAIFQADSTFINHSFYKSVFDLDKIKNGTYYTSASIVLENVILKSPVTRILEAKKRRTDGLCNFCRKSIAIPSDNLKNKKIKGIEFYFPKGKYHSSIENGRRVQSKNKQIELSIALINRADTVFLNQALYYVKDTLHVKKNRWNYYDLRKHNINVENANYIFISLRALSDMVLGRRKMNKNDADINYLERKYNKGRSVYFIDSRLFAPQLDPISLAYKIHYYD